MAWNVSSLIAGEDVGASDGQIFTRSDPVTGEIVSTAASASVADGLRSVEAAADAFERWRKIGPGARRKLLNKVADLIEERSDDFAQRILAELGFPASVAARNVYVATATLREAASITTQVQGAIVPSERPECLALAVREPRGVVFAIAPWNAPLALGVRSVAVALACGNTVVLKGSETCPATHRLIADIFQEAGFPPGVLNYVNCGPDRVAALVREIIASPIVRHVNFTGSTKVGRLIAEIAGRHLKPSLLELGGKAPVLILEDADLDAAAGAVAVGAFTNQGQICMSTERVIIQDSVADAFVAKLRERVLRLKVGDPRNPDTQLGALVSMGSVRSARHLIEDALSYGATLVTGNEFDGVIAKPTILDHVVPPMEIYQEESFGPIVSIIRVNGESEAIRVANDSDYGLSAAVFSQDISRALRVARAIRSGMCHINSPTLQAEPHMPFGGVGASGFGRFGGAAEIEEFTETRWITVANAKDVYQF